jgi:hypothetical protein
MTETTIGVDVSKDSLDVHLHPAGDHRQFENTPKGFRAILKWVAGRPVARLVFEATGPYHRAFERAMDEAGLPLCKVNPRQAKRFGEAIGQLRRGQRPRGDEVLHHLEVGGIDLELAPHHPLEGFADLQEVAQEHGGGPERCPLRPDELPAILVAGARFS